MYKNKEYLLLSSVVEVFVKKMQTIFQLLTGIPTKSIGFYLFPDDTSQDYGHEVENGNYTL